MGCAITTRAAGGGCDATRQLDTAYRTFVHGLEPPLVRLALAPSTFCQDVPAGNEPLTSVADLGLLDLELPLMLAETMVVPPDELSTIVAGGLFCLLSVLLHDRLSDEQLADGRELWRLRKRLHVEALRRWRTLFEPDAPFWDDYRGYFAQYNGALAAERARHVRRISPYDKAEFYALARQKCAPRKILLAAIARRAGETGTDKVLALSASLDAYAIADQILDDLADWQEDWSARRFTYLLTHLVQSHGLQQRIDPTVPAGRAEQFELGLYLFTAVELLGDLLDEAGIWLDEALHCVEGLACPTWQRYLQETRSNLVDKRPGLEAVVAAVRHSTAAGNGDRHRQKVTA